MRVNTPGNVAIEDLPAVPEISDLPADKEPGEPTPEQGTCACPQSTTGSCSRAIEGSEECEACPGSADTPACEHAPTGMAGVCDNCASMPSVGASNGKEVSRVVPSRPAIDVALESVRLHRDKHIAPLVARLRKWDVRKLTTVQRGTLMELLEAVVRRWDDLEEYLAHLRDIGFVAKTTEATRTRAKIENGASIQLVLHKWIELLPVYGAERLNSRLTCSQVTDTHAVITTEDGTCLGAIRMTHLRVLPVPLELADE
jgi:hypothetical protein